MLNARASLAATLPASPERALCVRLAGFVSFLRANGFAAGVDDTALLVETASRIDLLEPQLLRWSAQALLCRRAGDRQRFDELFDAWFLPPNRQRLVESRATGAGALDHASSPRTGAGGQGEGMPVAAADDAPAAAIDIEGDATQRGASDAAALETTDFRHLHQPDAMRALDALMRGFARELRRLALRREQAGGGRGIDMRGTARRSVSHGGEPVELAFRERRRQRPRLVLLLDVSRSMSLYSFFFLRLARALLGAHWDTHVFVWHTHLAEVGPALRDPDPWRAQERLQLLSAGWAGGTRIGECLLQFERAHAALVHARTALIVVSDGYDTGPAGLLAGTLQRLRRRARRLVWLNPLAGRDDYQPLARGIAAALPHLDLHAPAHDLASVERVLRPLVQALR
jgi:uncharacterized protein with von Willebrand factor type A (vWA) domain